MHTFKVSVKKLPATDTLGSRFQVRVKVPGGVKTKTVSYDYESMDPYLAAAHEATGHLGFEYRFFTNTGRRGATEQYEMTAS